MPAGNETLACLVRLIMEIRGLLSPNLAFILLSNIVSQKNGIYLVLKFICVNLNYFSCFFSLLLAQETTLRPEAPLMG